MKIEQKMLSGSPSDVLDMFSKLKAEGWKVKDMAQSSSNSYTTLTLLLERKIDEN
jgi:hypothetical protein